MGMARVIGRSLRLWPIFLLFLTAVNAAAAATSPMETPRFALLIGVDDYARNADGSPTANPLKGPGNDVALMKRLLVDRFSFHDDGTEIVTLIGRQATHAAIRDAYAKLIERAASAPGAIVLVYFSGHGSQADDQNGDEGDGVDETLVAYDSRTPGGSDILDDELAAWQAEMMQRAPQTKVTYIFDSCHSGTGMKMVTENSGLTARYLEPKRPLGPTTSAQTRTEPMNELLAEGRDYVLLAGSEASSLSYENAVDTTEGKVVHGLYTYYLDLALRQDPGISYETANRLVTSALRKASPSQLPQAEGAIERLVLDGTGEREDPFVPILAVEADGRFKIGAGAMFGLQNGAILAVYAPGMRKLVGNTGKIGDARIVTLGNGESTAQFTTTPSQPLTKDARVAVVTPFFGLESMRVRLDDLPGQVSDAQDRALLTDIAVRLRTDRFVTIAAPGDSWAVAVARGCYRDRLYLAGEVQPTGCPAAYYLHTKDSNAPLMGFHASRDSNTASAITEKIEDRARQENIRAIENSGAPIDGQVHLRLIKVNVVSGPDGRPIAQPLPAEPPRGVTPMKVGERFMLRVDNDSDFALYVAVYDLGSGGKNYLVGSTSHGDLIGPHHSMVVTPRPWVIGAPLGLESFKVIATTRSDVNFRVLDNQRATSRGAQEGPLEWLLSTTVDAAARDSGPGSTDLESWTTTRLDLQILP
jgi:hypothetical protein